ncbi:hypothetical protein AURDEDRAFT_167052 [Auricularia subglabra TFB-10046 SS5]|nr:hypothetical protein AURDEDRAFT_167052 [Auricularia subglabra TFB-10046 SS5]
MAHSARYEFTYFRLHGLGDLSRLLMDVAEVPYKNKFVDFDDSWTAVKESMTFGKVPRLTVLGSDGTKQELFESSAIEAYLAEALSFVPASDLFSRAECFSVAASIKDLDDKVHATSFLSTVEERRAAHEKNVAELIPSFLRYHERFLAARGGPYFFGSKVTIADLRLYVVYLKFDEIYGATNPFTAQKAQFPRLARLIETLDSGRAGDYARKRRSVGGSFRWLEDELKWATPKKA